MDKEELKKIVLEILGSENEEAFSEFLKTIAEHLQGNKTLKLDGIGHFQLKKEPLSRMERRGEGSEKEILIFLPEGETTEEKLISLEIEDSSLVVDEFDDSVFDISVNKPTIISEPESDEVGIDSKILEFVESGTLLENFDILSVQATDFQTNETIDIEEEIVEKEIDSITEDTILEDDVTEVHINKDFLIDSLDDEIVEDESLTDMDKNGFEEISSNIETKITEEDVAESESGIFEAEESINSIEDDENLEEIVDEIDEDKNPFDELDDYIKEETKDEAQDILDEAPDGEVGSEIIPEEPSSTETVKEEKSETKRKSYSALRNKSSEWYKNPVLLIAIFAAVVAVAVIFFFWPESEESTLVESGETIELNSAGNNIEKNKIDSMATIASAELSSKKDEKQTDNEKLAEVKNIKSKESSKPVKKETSKVSTKGLYRDIPNDQTVTQRIYTDGVKFTVQSSSWKSTSIAENEVRKLRKRGFDSFIYKVFIKSKGSTWNRVRIGYFNSRKEAEEFLKKNKI